MSSGQGKSENRQVCLDRLVRRPLHIGVVVDVVADVETDAGADKDAASEAWIPCSPDDVQAPPRVAADSKTQHRNPLASKCLAVTSPAEPAPITATSIIVFVVVVGCVNVLLLCVGRDAKPTIDDGDR